MQKKPFKQHMMELFLKKSFIDTEDKWGAIKENVIEDLKYSLGFGAFYLISFAIIYMTI